MVLLPMVLLPPIAYFGRIVFLIVTTIIFAVALLAYVRVRKTKTLLLSVGFGLFFLHALLSITELLSRSFDLEFTTGYHLLIDSIALLCILVGALKD
jgi:hypothetical protein